MKDFFEKPNQLYQIPAVTETINKFLDYVEQKKTEDEWKSLSTIIDFESIIKFTFSNMSNQEYYQMYALLNAPSYFNKD